MKKSLKCARGPQKNSFGLRGHDMTFSFFQITQGPNHSNPQPVSFLPLVWKVSICCCGHFAQNGQWRKNGARVFGAGAVNQLCRKSKTSISQSTSNNNQFQNWSGFAKKMNIDGDMPKMDILTILKNRARTGSGFSGYGTTLFNFHIPSMKNLLNSPAFDLLYSIWKVCMCERRGLAQVGLKMVQNAHN